VSRDGLARIPLSAPPRLGFDLDLTLLDLRGATEFALRGTNARLGLNIDVDAVLADLGAPFRAQLATWVEANRMDVAMRTFYREFMESGLAKIEALPGAEKVLATVQARDGFSMVITGRRKSVAMACLRRCGLAVPVVVGGVFGPDKAVAMREHRIDAYVGDHLLDMHASVAAGVPGIGVGTGSHAEQPLADAGAATVVPTLETLVPWLSAN
jgi:phosphoglycolate phosphatase